MKDLRRRQQSLICRISLIEDNIAKSKKDLGFLKHRRIYWIDGRKNQEATRLEAKISRGKKTKNRLVAELCQVDAAIETEKKERTSWTICSNIECNQVDRAGGKVCPVCSSEMQIYLSE